MFARTAMSMSMSMFMSMSAKAATNMFHSIQLDMHLCCKEKAALSLSSLTNDRSIDQ